jgi:hypothetical protein
MALRNGMTLVQPTCMAWADGDDGRFAKRPQQPEEFLQRGELCTSTVHTCLMPHASFHRRTKQMPAQPPMCDRFAAPISFAPCFFFLSLLALLTPGLVSPGLSSGLMWSCLVLSLSCLAFVFCLALPCFALPCLAFPCHVLSCSCLIVSLGITLTLSTKIGFGIRAEITWKAMRVKRYGGLGSSLRAHPASFAGVLEGETVGWIRRRRRRRSDHDKPGKWTFAGGVGVVEHSIVDPRDSRPHFARCDAVKLCLIPFPGPLGLTFGNKNARHEPMAAELNWIGSRPC